MVKKKLNLMVISQGRAVSGCMPEVIGRRNKLFPVKGFSFLFFCYVFCAICYALTCSCAKPLYKDTFVVAGTFLEVISSHRDAARVVYAEFRSLEKTFNFYDPASELGRLNGSYQVSCRVSPEMLEVLQLAKQVYAASDGAFDPSCGVLFEFWKNLIRKAPIRALPAKEEIEELKKKCGMDGFEVDFQKRTVTIKKAGLKIDLAAIAKGYMVDRAVLQLKKHGIRDALINAGGDIYCLGKNSGKPWVVGVKNPQGQTNIIDSEGMVDEAIATSGDYEQFFECAGRRYSHLIDPRSGYPINNTVASASVIAANCALADSFATAFCIVGPEHAKKILAIFPVPMRIFIVTIEKGNRRTHRIR